MSNQKDLIFDVATGHGAKSRTWKNKKARWSKFVKRLSRPVITSETFREYELASKDERSKIKDVGGYFGGYLNKGRRKPANVMHRQLLTLDIDYAPAHFWDEITLALSCACVLHSTHSHSPQSPRYRLIIPLNREVTGEQYTAISRKIAENIGIDLFDDTTFQVHRLMFWPSVSKDMPYEFHEQKGSYLNADDVLAQYTDWTDASAWAMSSRNVQQVRTDAEKQQDPETKRGIVGVYCRTYGIHEAIEKFLTDQYTATELEDRYTFTGGSTYAGLVVYDNKYAYSHHGTDPASGTLCNSFDLVRRHKFTHMTDKESFKEMETLALNDVQVKKTLAVEKIELAKYDFAEDLPAEYEPPEDDLSWTVKLEADGRGNYLSSSTNLNLIFANDSRLKNAFKFNEFDRKEYITKSMPWREIDNPEPVKNIDHSGIRNYIECIYGISGVQKIRDAVALEFQRGRYHPIKQFLDLLEWDGVKRLDTLLIDYFGAVDNEYTRQAARKTFTAAVARIYEPGCKFDLVLTLVGVEATGKSTFVRAFGREWASDTFTTVHGKESFEQLQGAWLIEMAELSAMKKAEVEQVKHFVSKQIDQFRPAYKEVSEVFPRQCVFIATTNEIDFLRSTTGNRRFLPIDVNLIKATKDIFSIPDYEVDQVWAEAVERYKAGERLYLEGKALRTARVEQKEHALHDDREGLILKYLDTPLPDDWDNLDIWSRRNYLDDPLSGKTGKNQREFVCVAEIWAECLQKDIRDMDRYKTREIHGILANLPQWERAGKTRRFELYGTQKYYERNLM
jgi:putative DNA primase/helicase